MTTKRKPTGKLSDALEAVGRRKVRPVRAVAEPVRRWNHVDCFTSLDDLKGKDQGDPTKVLRAIMAAGGRFSIFDATANQRIAGTMDRLERSGWMRRTKDQPGYPWMHVELTADGRRELAQQPVTISPRKR